MPERPNDPVTTARCAFCGEAVPEGAPCPSCGGQELTVAQDAKSQRRLSVRRKLYRGARIFVVLTVVMGLTYALVSSVVTGPARYADPLTTAGAFHINAGNFTFLSGAITGEDYIVGNYTVVHPAGASITFQVYNSTQFHRFAHHQPSSPAWSVAALPSGHIVFAAPYTDTFYLVFQNPYQAASGIGETVYVSTTYQSNVVIG